MTSKDCQKKSCRTYNTQVMLEGENQDQQEGKDETKGYAAFSFLTKVNYNIVSVHRSHSCMCLMLVGSYSEMYMYVLDMLDSMPRAISTHMYVVETLT